MPYYMYVAVQGDNKISVFTVDPDTGGMTLQTDVAVDGGPFTMAISPDRRFLYVGCREITQLVSFEIDQPSGGLTQNGSVPLDAWPVYVATDRRGRFVLSSYYQGARVAVHPVGDDGSVGGDAVVSLETATRRPRHADRSDQRLRFRATHRRQRPQLHLAVPVRREHRPHHPQLAGHGGPGGVPRAAPLLLPSVAGRALLLQRAGLQRQRLQPGPLPTARCRFPRR